MIQGGLLRRAARLTASALLLAAGGAPKTLRVLPNGAAWDEDPFRFSAESLEELRERVEASPLGKGLHFDVRYQWWLADENGAEVTDWAQVIALPGPAPRLSAVPAGRPYQWGPRTIGERFPVSLSDKSGVEMETVASLPRIFLVHELMTEEETLSIIEGAGEQQGEYAMKSSGTGFQTSGPRVLDSRRTSDSAFMVDGLAVTLMKRCFELARIPWSQQMADGLQVLRYAPGQAYVTHTDWFHGNKKAEEGQIFDSAVPGGSNRYATVFLYLWPPPSGGETVFPEARVEKELNDSAFVSIGKDEKAAELAMTRAKQTYKEGAWELELVEKCKTRLSVKPLRRGAVLFYHQDPMTGRLLHEATHGACPSLTGTKWGANVWIWNTNRHFSGRRRAPTPGKVSGNFINLEAEPLELEYSMDGEEATWSGFKTVPPGSQIGAATFTGHSWRWLRADGAEVSRWRVQGAAGEVVNFTTKPEEPLARTEM